MAHANVNPSQLLWSRLRAGLTLDEIAAKLPARTDKVLAWESGESRPTFIQAQKWAKVAHIPFGFLFLARPPQERLPIPDLRTVGCETPSTPSLDLLETVKDVLRKQAWYIDYLREHEADALPFVGRFSAKSKIADVVADIRRVLGADVGDRPRSADEYLRTLISAADQAGVLVMRSGIVGSNTHRPLDVGEFRGFAISDPLAPTVFINSADAPKARIFTLVHELAHIWIGSSGISTATVREARDEEVFCNAVAGEFLAPGKEFSQRWDEGTAWIENVGRLADTFRVSTLTAARRAADLGFITRAMYREFYTAELEAFRNRNKGGGGDFYTNLRVRNSTSFSRAVAAEAMSGRVLLRDAGALLSIHPAKIRTFAGDLLQ
ncbi:XRE family transcriptional regulator [Denitromonas iodatirespirans]|uniref:ImmA/IrrE family metallo-endopeptidase n=1 Tax=Denitromonas iodatirespirans TaxID=2795389 RepID=A0A944DFG0_DENI1|nr:XRE family transcriptional regulator [Denitromonas iodatirespirans]MBT0964006.1 ImmA/IrrE family metallo-endopeptidase [Denitromonas iodatirespirans]